MSVKVDKLDAHDRFEYYKKQDFDISACCQDLLDKRPFGDYPFYMFAHFRTDDDGVTKRLIWQPRLTKPFAQTNSMLFKGYPGTDIIKVIWMIPAIEIWPNFKKGQLTENELITESIHDFQHNRSKLEAKEDDDLSDEKIDDIYRELAREAKNDWKKI
jgi:hypothetical protein